MIKPVAGLDIEFRCNLVTLGTRTPLIEELTSSIADPCAGFPDELMATPCDMTDEEIQKKHTEKVRTNRLFIRLGFGGWNIKNTSFSRFWQEYYFMNY
jgi:hypothetical protein